MANIIHKTNHSTEYVWNVVKKIRSAILVQDSCIDGVFPHTGVFFSRFSNKLQSKKEDAIALKDMNETTLATAANIFLYLNSCPTPLKPWFVAYKQMFEIAMKKKANKEFIFNRILEHGCKAAAQGYFAARKLKNNKLIEEFKKECEFLCNAAKFDQQ